MTGFFSDSAFDCCRPWVWFGAINGGKILLVSSTKLLTQAANDAAAATAGVAVGAYYASGSQVMQRQA